MKTNSTMRLLMLALIFAVSFTACKKDKNDPAPPPPVEVKAMTFAELKALSTSASVKVPDARKITGIVISDASAKNIDGKTVILQDAAIQTGIIITFDAAQTFAAGDQLEVTISNQMLAQVDGEIVLQNVPAANAKKTGTGTITPKTTTITEIGTNKTAWDGTLVTIAATELSGGNGKYTGNLVVKDASGTSATRILSGASFAGDDYPVSVSSLTGIVRISGNDVFLDIRKPSDVVVGAINRVLTETFENPTFSFPSDGVAADGSFTGDFSTNSGEWLTQGGVFNSYLLEGNLYDGSFTIAGRKYLYLYRNLALPNVGGNTTAHLRSQFTNLQGVKTVAITFAGSKANKRGSANIAAFNEATDYVQIGIYPSLIAGYPLPATDQSKLHKLSPQYKKTGEWYTFSYTLPTKAEMLAAGVSEADADAFIANPNIIIANYSTRAAPAAATENPIIIDKVVFGF